MAQRFRESFSSLDISTGLTFYKATPTKSTTAGTVHFRCLSMLRAPRFIEPGATLHAAFLHYCTLTQSHTLLAHTLIVAAAINTRPAVDTWLVETLVNFHTPRSKVAGRTLACERFRRVAGSDAGPPAGADPAAGLVGRVAAFADVHHGAQAARALRLRQRNVLVDEVERAGPHHGARDHQVAVHRQVDIVLHIL